jgi:hypothetical protein
MPTSATPESGTPRQRIELGPSPLELFRIFRMPAATTALGLLFLIVGLVSGTSGHNLAIILGVVILALTGLLAGMELHDLTRSWVVWDETGITLEHGRRIPLTLPWDDVATVCLHECVGGRRRTPGRSWIYLEVRPLDWHSLGRDAEQYQDLAMTADAVGVSAGAGDTWLERLDAALRAAGLPAYTGVTVTQLEDPRATWRRTKMAQPRSGNPFNGIL